MRDAREAIEEIGERELAESSRSQGLVYSLAKRLTQANANVANHNNSAVADSNSDDASDNNASINDANSDVVDIYLAQARAYQAERQWQKAINACQAALKISLNSAEVYRLLGNLHQQQDKVPDALGFYAKALSLQPHSAEVYSNLGSLYAKQKDWGKATAYFEKALSKDPQFAPAYFNLSKVWKQRNNAEEAQACLLTALKLAPDMGTAQDHYQMAQSLEEEKKVEDAITFYRQFVERAPERSPNTLSAYQRLTELLEEKGDWKSATECYHKVMELTTPAAAPVANLPAKTKPHKASAPPNLSGLSKRDQHLMYRLLQASAQKKMLLPGKSATALLQPAANSSTQLASQATSQPVSQQQLTHQQWAQAVRQLKQAVKRSPRSAPLYRKLAKALSYNQQIEQSAEAWFRAFLLEPEWPSSQQYFELGKRLETYGKVKAAAHCYQQVLRAQPENNAVREKLLQLQQQIGQSSLDQEKIDPSQLKKQGVSVQKSSAQAPETQQRTKSPQVLKPKQVQSLANAIHQKGEALRKAGDWDAACQAYQKAIQLNPAFSWSHHNLGICYQKLEKWAAAAQAYQSACRLNPDFVWSYYNLGEVLEKAARWEDAANAYRQALTIQPENDQAANRLIYALQQYLKTQPRNIALYVELAEQFASQGKTSDCISTYQMAIQIQPDSIELTQKLADVLRSTDPDKAKLLDAQIVSISASSEIECQVRKPENLRDLETAVKVLSRTNLFDARYYQTQTSESSSNPGGLIRHYLEIGSYTGMQPNPLFNDHYYLSTYKDVAELDVNPLVHYHLFGYKQGYQPHPYFSTQFYQAQNSEVTVTDVDPLNHYLTNGAKLGKRAFNPQWSLNQSVKPTASFTDLLFNSLDFSDTQSAQRREKKVGLYVSTKGNYFLTEIAHLVATALQQAGHQVLALNEYSKPVETLDDHWIIAPHEFFYLGEDVSELSQQGWLEKSTLINVEQPQTTWFSKAFHYLRHAKLILDINPQTALMLREMHLPAKWLPLGYIKNYQPLTAPTVLPAAVERRLLPVQKQLPLQEANLSERAIDVCFIGTLSQRREAFFSESASWLSQYQCFLHLPTSKTFSKDDAQILDMPSVVSLSRRSKILLNIHRDNVPYFEWHRIVLYGLWQQTLVLSEPCLDIPGLVPEKHFLTCSLDKMNETIDWLLNTLEGQKRAEEVRTAGYYALTQNFDMRQLLVSP